MQLDINKNTSKISEAYHNKHLLFFHITVQCGSDGPPTACSYAIWNAWPPLRGGGG